MSMSIKEFFTITCPDLQRGVDSLMTAPPRRDMRSGLLAPLFAMYFQPIFPGTRVEGQGRSDEFRLMPKYG